MGAAAVAVVALTAQPRSSLLVHTRGPSAGLQWRCCFARLWEFRGVYFMFSLLGSRRNIDGGLVHRLVINCRCRYHAACFVASVISNAGRWTKPEHDAFVEGLRLYGKEWKRVAKLIPTRTVVQIRTHAQKYFQKLAKDMGVDEAYIHANVLTPPKAGVALASPGSAAVPAAVGSGGGA